MEPQNLLESQWTGHHLSAGLSSIPAFGITAVLLTKSAKSAQTLSAKINYGNMDTSDWKGLLNSNTNIPELRGFWLESSLKISPVEQTRVLAKSLRKTPLPPPISRALWKYRIPLLKFMVKPEWASKTTRLSMHGLVGFYETADNKIFFAVRLDDNDNNAAPGYRPDQSNCQTNRRRNNKPWKDFLTAAAVKRN